MQAHEVGGGLHEARYNGQDPELQGEPPAAACNHTINRGKRP